MKTAKRIFVALAVAFMFSSCYKNDEFCWRCEHEQIMGCDTIRFITIPCDLNDEDIKMFVKLNSYEYIYNGNLVATMKCHCMKMTCPE